MQDKSGRAYLKIADAKQGLVELDGDFTCHRDGPTMLYDHGRGLYFNCDEGKHYLAGQIKDDYYIGVYPCVSINR